MDDVLHILKDYVHVALGGVLALWLYKDKVDKMSLSERATYCGASIFIGVYGGNGINDVFDIDPASPKAHAVSVLVAIFGLALLALAKEQLPLIFASWRKKISGE